MLKSTLRPKRSFATAAPPAEIGRKLSVRFKVPKTAKRTQQTFVDEAAKRPLRCFAQTLDAGIGFGLWRVVPMSGASLCN